MYVERLKRWQWMIVGVILGAIVGWVKLWGGVDAPDSGTHLHVFEDQLIKAVDPSRKHPLQVGQIILHLPSEVPLLGSKELGKREIITYWVWYPQKLNDKKEVIAVPKEHAVVLYRDPAQKSVFGDISKLGGREY